MTSQKEKYSKPSQHRNEHAHCEYILQFSAIDANEYQYLHGFKNQSQDRHLRSPFSNGCCCGTHRWRHSDICPLGASLGRWCVFRALGCRLRSRLRSTPTRSAHNGSVLEPLNHQATSDNVRYSWKSRAVPRTDLRRPDCAPK